MGWLIGTTCGLLGGWFDTLCVRLMETLASIPFLFLAIVVLALVRGRVVPSVTVALLVAAVAWVPVARLVRAQTLVERTREHVLALRVVGIPEGWILVRHILPATLPAAATAAARCSTTPGVAYLGGHLDPSSLPLLLPCVPPLPVGGGGGGKDLMLPLLSSVRG